MRLISREEIASLSLLRESAEAIRDAYIAATDGRAQLPPVGYLGFPDRNADCHVKFGHIAGDPIFVVKMSCGFYDNPAIGLASNNGIVVAMSARTGEVVAVLDDRGLLTELRTAVGGATATLALARRNAQIVGVVGAGTQARQQVRALSAISDRSFEFVVWARRAQGVAELARELSADGIQVRSLGDVRELCTMADVIVTTTPASTPLLCADWIKPGTHITAVGADAPGKQELDLDVVAGADRLFADLIAQSLDHGEFSNAYRKGLLDVGGCVELGSVLANRAVGRQSDDETTIVDLTGLAVQDIAITRIVLERLNTPAGQRRP